MAFDDLGLAEPSTVTKNLAVQAVTRNSSVQYQEIMSIGSPTSTTSSAVAEVLVAAPNSTAPGLAVRIVSGPSTATDFAVRALLPSTATDNPVSAAQASTTWAVQMSQYSTTQQVSSVGGQVATRPASTLWASSAGFHFDSSGALQITGASASTQVKVSGNSSASDYIPVRIVDSSGTGFLTPGNDYTAGSTYSSHAGPTLAYDNSSNNTYRTAGVATPFPVQIRTGTLSYASTTSFVTSTHSTAVYALISSVASQRHKVYAVSVYSTHTRPSTILFLSSLAQTIHGIQFGSGSSGVTGAIPSVSPPGFLFATEAGAALNVVVEDGSTAASTTLVRVNVSYFTEA